MQTLPRQRSFTGRGIGSILGLCVGVSACNALLGNSTPGQADAGLGGEGGERASSTGGSAATGGNGASGGSKPAGGAPAQGGSEAVVAVRVGYDTSCASRRDGRIKCWGQNAAAAIPVESELVVGDDLAEMGAALPEVLQPEGLPGGSIQVGGAFLCGLSAAGEVTCWGDNQAGQCGRGSADSPLPLSDEVIDLGVDSDGQPWRVADLALGWDHACALLDGSGEVKCWGNDYFGQLGVSARQYIGDAKGELGRNLSSVELPGPASAISAGYGFSCALLEDDSVRCWGRNEEGELGIGSTENISDEPDEFSAKSVAVPLPSGKPRALVSGGGHSCVLFESGKVACWGANTQGQLGVGSTADVGATPFGSGETLRWVDFGTDVQVVEVAAGGYHNCARFEDGSLRCWGEGSWGQLGMDYQTIGDYPGEKIPLVNVGGWNEVISIAAGAQHSCAVLADHTVKCWGDNRGGQLGVGILSPSDPNEEGTADVTNLGPIPLW